MSIVNNDMFCAYTNHLSRDNVTLALVLVGTTHILMVSIPLFIITSVSRASTR